MSSGFNFGDNTEPMQGEGMQGGEMQGEAPSPEELSFDDAERQHYRNLAGQARNNPFFVQCDEEIFELNDDGSERVHGKKDKPENKEAPEGELADEQVATDGDSEEEQGPEEDGDTYTDIDDEDF
jgi:hypothetical protein